MGVILTRLLQSLAVLLVMSFAEKGVVPFHAAMDFTAAVPAIVKLPPA